jgi:nitronate monooxygenase
LKPTRREFIPAAGVMAAALEGDAAQSELASSMPTPRAKALMTLFGLKYPIFEAPHGPTTSPELAIAVSNAGAMGAIALTRFTADRASEAVAKIRSATTGRFFINYILALSSGNEPESLRAALDAGAPIVQFSWGLPPKNAIAAIRAAGAKMGLQVTSSESARAALDLGADYLVCQGTEAGGHVQAARGLYETLPIVLEESRQRPVIASGGIGDGQGIRRALLAGASAAMLGTRFVSTIESNAHPAHQKAIIAAHAKDTALTMCFQDGWPAMHRALRNPTFIMWETAGCPSPGRRPGEADVVAIRPDGQTVLRYWDGSPTKELQGSPSEMALFAGLSVDFVKDVPAAGTLVQRLWRECMTAQGVRPRSKP